MDTQIISSPWGLVVKVFKILFLLDRSEDRISRGQYWIGNSMLGILFALLNLGIYFIEGNTGIIISIVVNVIYFILNLLRSLKRLHDLNKNRLWLMPMLLILLGAYGFLVYGFVTTGSILGFIDTLLGLSNGQGGIYMTVVLFILGVISGLIFIELISRKSVNENNRFGPDPLRNITVSNPFYRVIVIVFIFLSIFLDTVKQKDNNDIDNILSSTDFVVDRLDESQASANNMIKQADLNMIGTTLEIYNADYDAYPIRESFVSADTLSTVLTGEYIREFPEGSQEYFYKTITRDSQPNKAFILMVKIDNTSKYNKINYVGDKSGLESKTFEEIQTLLDNYIPVSGDQQGWYVYLSM